LTFRTALRHSPRYKPDALEAEELEIRETASVSSNTRAIKGSAVWGSLLQEDEGETLEEVFDLFDKEGDQYIACRDRALASGNLQGTSEK
jgi:Ca2+-binding EF-hand superfamily protein